MVLRAGIVSYLNSEPLLRGLRGELSGALSLVPAVPSALPDLLASRQVDLALLPVAALPRIPGARPIASWGIAADGPVASVALYADVPMREIHEVMLDEQSCTSVALARLLLAGHWRQRVRFTAATPGSIERIGGSRAAVVIGDRALAIEGRFPYKWDLAEAWQGWTGLPFVFAVWTGFDELPRDFARRFDAAHEAGLRAIPDVVADHAGRFAVDLDCYFNRNLRFRLDGRMFEGLSLFLSRLPSPAPASRRTALEV